MTLETIKEAVAGLPEEERHSLASWLNELEYDAWDKQMVKDFSPGGRGMTLVEKVKREIAEGKTMPLEEALAQAKAKREQLWLSQTPYAGKLPVQARPSWLGSKVRSSRDV